ncbi:Cullin family-domain-containing protein [Gaertneriomyces semiglobifer]|nr:Cullin family-domain-containing protein [Gaertneriomyces semiglobifer]
MASAGDAQLSSKAKGKAPMYAAEFSSLGMPAPLKVKKEPARKLVIKGFNVKPKLPENYFADTWAKLDRAVHAIHENRPVPDSLEELYKSSENLCHYKKGEEMYQRLRSIFEQHLATESMRVKRAGPTDILKTVCDSWTAHCRQMRLIRNIFLYLDRTYVLQTSGVRSLWDTGLELYRSCIMDDDEIRAWMVKELLREIETERRGEKVDRKLLRSLLRMLVELSIYFSVFDAPFREASEQFYKDEGRQLTGALQNGEFTASALSQYLKHVEDRLQEETERSTPGIGYLDVGSRKALLAIVDKQLVKEHIATILGKGMVDLMNDMRIPDLKRLHQLCTRIASLDDLRKAFGSFVHRSGFAIIAHKDRDPTMVEDLLAFKRKVDTMLAEAFARNPSFAHEVQLSFEKFINERHDKPAELIAKYVDGKLRSPKGVTEEEIESALDHCLVLFRYIQGKDIFEAFYKNDLARRLLLQRSTSVDAEKSMLAKLKAECGPGFTSKLEGMFKDMEVSRDYLAAFRETPKFTNRLGNIDLHVFILTQSYWPTYQPVVCNLPEELALCQEVFREFYISKHNGRRLTFQNTLGTCIIRSNFPKGKKELSVSLFQALCLLPFNHGDRFSYTDLQQASGLEDGELERTLQSLACAKIKVLTKIPHSKNVTRTDMFEYNANFEHNLFRIKVNQIQMKETAEEQKMTEERVFQDRQYQVDAAIVRILKSRKTITHAVLASELLDQLKFMIETKDLKKRIESLIEREYMERDPKDNNVYHYVA